LRGAEGGCDLLRRGRDLRQAADRPARRDGLRAARRDLDRRASAPRAVRVRPGARPDGRHLAGAAGPLLLRRRRPASRLRLTRLGLGPAQQPGRPDPAHLLAATAPVVPLALRGSITASTIPYSTASSGLMKRSRSMSRRTLSTFWPECCEMTSAIRLVMSRISRAAIWMSAGVPRKPPEPWWIMTFEFGSRKRFPAAPPARIIAPADIAIPTA